jgi:outer membrane receptor protein involved in Fe transport
MALTSVATAQARDINIPAEDLKSALDSYIRQSGVQLVYTVKDVEGQRSHAVDGHYEPAPALDQLLQGTQLAANRDAAGNVIVAKRLTAGPDFGPAGASAGVEQVVVTGSRVISDVANSPTPLTVVSTQQLQATTPSNIPDALNKLPIFQGSNNPRGSDNGSSNNAGNVLNLRNFGAQRTLILLDGHRVAPTNANGTVDIDTLPQMLMSRVDVVTGGASAVYGSDAVTGVVNFVLDKKFDGIKFDINSGISTYGDAASYKAGVAAGTDLFGGKGHIEGSLQHFHQDGVPHNSRPEGPRYFLLTGNGTSAATAFTTTMNSRLSTLAYGGKITCTACTVNGQQFLTGGQIAPYNPGVATTSAGIASGGDGTVDTISQITSTLTTDEAFGRFDYAFADNLNFFVQGQAAQSHDKASFTNIGINTGTAPNAFYKNNPFLTAAAQTALGNNGTNAAGNGTATLPANTFQIGETILLPGAHDGYQTIGTASNLSITAGLDGTLADGKYAWNIYYTHGQSRLKVDDPNNINQTKLYASEDAVVNPATGVVSCYAATQAATAAAYAGCVPINPFGPGSVSLGAFNYLRQDTNFVITNILDDLGGAISGEIFDLPAGPVKAALSAESRWAGYDVQSNAVPTQLVDCTGLRLCTATVNQYGSNAAAALAPVSQNVWEFAGEVNIPILKGIPLVQDLSADIAGRYTNYSVSGEAQTWKIGLDWHINDTFRLRGTNSIDIRAPTLNDLFSPLQLTPQSFTDLHTVGNPTQNVNVASVGNPLLVPEVARTYTAGLVVTPSSFIPGLTMSLDYYNIVLKNAITSLSASTASVKTTCENSGGTSPLCALYVRPLPFSDHSVANFPTLTKNLSLNAASNKLEGLDFETDYGFDMADIMDSLPGSVDLRLLANYQPVNETQQYATAPLTFTSLSKGHVTGFVNYQLGNWGISLQNRWYSGYSKIQSVGQFYADPRVKSIDYLDVNLDRKFQIDDAAFDAYFSVQNIGDTRPPINPINGTNPGLYFLSAKSLGGANQLGYDAIGRYFTIGLRANL